MSRACVITDNVTGESFVLDSAETITGTITANPTEHPVELGVAIVDHIQPQAETLVVTGVVSETPANAGQDKGASRITRWQSFVRNLGLGHPCTVVSYRYGTMLNMGLVSCPIPITSDRAVKVSLSFKQVRIVSAVLVENVGASNSTASITDVTTLLQSNLDYANLTVQYNLGAQPTSKTAPTSKQTSVAYELAHAVGLV